jgi:photosystem II stability/assembly factor-like uncharacterized protein
VRRLLLALGLLVLSLAPSASAAGGEIPGWTPVSCSCGHALSLDQVDTDRAYLGTDAGVNRTDDGGWTWKPLAFPISGEARRVSFADRDNGAVVGSFEGVAVTRDGGTSWTQYRPWTGRSYDVVALPEVWYGLAESGLYASTDRGRVWKQLHASFLPLTTYQRMAWSDKDTGVVSNAAYAFTTSDGGRTWTSAATSSLYAFDALSLSPGEAAVGGERSVHSGRPWVGHVEASRHAPYTLADRGVSDEQVHGLARSGSTLYAVGVEGLLARSTDAGRSWTYEATPPSYERSTFYDVDTLDADHAMVAVYSGRVLLRQAPTVHDVTTTPHRGLGLGLGGLALVAAGGASWALVTKKPKVVAGALAGVTLAAGVPGALLALDSRTCHPSGCDPVTAAGSDEDGFVAPPSPTPSTTPSPTPSATPSPTPSPTASPTPSPTASPTPSPTASPTPLGAFTVTPVFADSHCTQDGNSFVPAKVTLTLRNGTALPVDWTAVAAADDPNQLPAWADVSPASGENLLPASKVSVQVTPNELYCNPELKPSDHTVTVTHGASHTIVTIRVHPPTG